MRSDTDVAPAAPPTPKGRKTRQKIKQGARQEFARLGYNDTRVADIVRAADVSHGTFYRYFTDKMQVRDELLSGLLVDVASFARASWAPDDPMRSVLLTTERYFAFYGENRDLYRLLIDAAQREPHVSDMLSHTRSIFYQRISRMLTVAKDRGLLRAGLVPDVAAALLGGMTEHAAYLAFVEGRDDVWDLSVVTHQVALLWEFGVFEWNRPNQPSECKRESI